MAYKRISPQPVVEGGTGSSSFTAYSVITGGTSSTGSLQNVSGVGTAGQLLTSNGAAALPTWQDGPVIGSSVFSAFAQTNQPGVAGTGLPFYTVVFDGILANVGSDFDGTSTYTAPASGVYFFSVTLSLNGVDNTNTEITILLANPQVNGGLIVVSPSVFPTTGPDGIMVLGGSAIIPLAIGEQVFVDIVAYGGGSLNVGVMGGAAPGGAQSLFSGYRLL